MKQIHKFILRTFPLAILILNFAYAEDSQLIASLNEKHQNVSHYQASFVQQKNVSYISKPLITTGRLEFALGSGLIWEVDKPLWVKTLITEAGVFKSTKYQNKQKVKDVQIKLIAEIMTELLTANLDKIESHFKITSAEENQTGTWKIDLVPKKMMMKKALKQITLKGDLTETKNDVENINEIVITDKSGNLTQIKLTDVILYKGELTMDIKSKYN